MYRCASPCPVSWKTHGPLSYLQAVSPVAWAEQRVPAVATVPQLTATPLHLLMSDSCWQLPPALSLRLAVSLYSRHSSPPVTDEDGRSGLSTCPGLEGSLPAQHSVLCPWRGVSLVAAGPTGWERFLNLLYRLFQTCMLAHSLYKNFFPCPASGEENHGLLSICHLLSI